LIFLGFANSSYAEKNFSPNVIWSSESGIARLQSSEFKNDFYQLVNFYQPQINPIYCSAASAVTVLNALKYGKISSQKQFEITPPSDSSSKVLDYKLYSQENFFNERTDVVKSRDVINYKAKRVYGNEKIYDAGLSLAELSRIFEKVYHVENKIFYVEKNDEESRQNFRQVMKKIFSEKQKFIIANFDGKILGQPTGGHFSPIVAYDEKSDSVLVLDVALHKNLWYWVATEKLYQAMNTKDVEYFHGYIIVGK